MSSNSKKTKSKTDTDSPRQHDIEVAAYYIAESGGFNSGCDIENWLVAEAKIDQLVTEEKD